MLEVQKYLKNPENTIERLSDELGIKLTFHDDLPLVILNYDQIESAKLHPIVMECRSLVLELHTWKVVAKSFTRFFNYGESPELTGKFDWSNPISSLTKEDGSIMIMYNYNGQWMVNTRGTFGNLECNFSGKTWNELFYESLLESEVKSEKLDENCTYIWEFCSVYNKVVKHYDKPQSFLLGMTDNERCIDIHPNSVDDEADWMDCQRPKEYKFENIDQVYSHLEYLEEYDPTNEGVVLRDCNGLRIKLKNKKYLTLHHMRDNGNLFNPKNMLPWVLAGERDELLTYFPEAKDNFDEMHLKVFDAYYNLSHVWSKSKKIEDQKEFALYITKERKEPFNSLLFQMKKEKCDNKKDLWYKFKNSEKLILKVLFDK